jgi:hypothetical protein
MRNLSKIFIFCLLAFVSMQSFAQKIGVQGGINLATMLIKDDETTYSDDFTMNLGFNAGVTLEIGFGSLISLEAGIMADTKGFKWEGEMLGVPFKSTTNLLYLDVPVLLKVGPSLGPVKIFGAAGPYIGYGLTGKIKTEAMGESETTDINWGDADDSDFKPLDYGAKFGAGVQVMGFTAGAYYSLGLANLSPSTDGGAKINNRVISVSLGYKFGK